MALTSLKLGPGQAHLWRHSLLASGERGAALAATLAHDERERAAALRILQQRARFIMGRGLLRETLARYTATPPEALQLCLGLYGKPALAGLPNNGLRFNLSHCDDLLIIAVARGREVGVDLERVQPIMSINQIGVSLLCPEERAALERAAPERRDQLFTRLWTRHEAVVKGEGSGLAHKATALRDWSVFELSPNAGYIASLALEGEGWRTCATASLDDTSGPWASFVKLSQG